MKYGYGRVSTASQYLELQLLEKSSYTQVEEITGSSKSTLIRAKREVTKGLF